jgi:hypothetical protein
MRIKATVQEIKTGAIYKFTAKRRMPRADIETLLRDRAGLPERTASLLAGHWITTQYYRNGYRFAS